MVGTSRDLMSVVDEVKVCYARILESHDCSLTTIQKNASRDRLIKELKDDGISFVTHGDSEDEHTFMWSSACVTGTGIITDVRPFGAFPISLSVGHDVTVTFEPRDLKRVDKFNRDKISNVEFAPLKKGSVYEFQGRILSCDYHQQIPNGRFHFRVDNDQSESAIVKFLRNEFRDLFGNNRIRP